MNIVLPQSGTRTLQRKLYRKAKQAEDFRFYALYDKIYRMDILHRAYDLVKANGGGPGLDGQTCELIEQEEGKVRFISQLREELVTRQYQAQPVKRVYIPKGNDERRALGIPTIRDRVVQMAVKLVLEPIFEADFSEYSFGYRPKRQAHQAIDTITEAMRFGHVKVIDADLSKYFDTIPHDKLLRSVSERISDGSVLGLLKQWLKAPIIEEKQGKLTVVGGGQGCRHGTPQGGVISPLLSNIYLNILDRIWRRHEIEKRFGARLVRYADDMVVLCAKDTERPLSLVKSILERLELKLNQEKTVIVDARVSSFQFLGFSIKQIRSERTGKWFPYVEPSKKAISSIKEKMRRITSARMTLVPLGDIVKRANNMLRGWGNYFRYGNCFRQLSKVRAFSEQRLRIHLCHRHKVRRTRVGYLKFPYRAIYEKYGLYKLEVKPLWKHAHALG